jgi:hypothetical protein
MPKGDCYEANGRFIGRKLAVDVGTLLSKDMEGIPLPILNFTYHM